MRTEISPPTTPPSEIMASDNSVPRIGMTAFVGLSLIGFALFAALSLLPSDIEPAGFALFALMFAVSYVSSRHAKSPGTSVYLFVITAPVAMNMLLTILAPQFGSAVTGFVGVFLTYSKLTSGNLV